MNDLAELKPARRVLVGGAVINLLLAGAKVLVGFIAGSQALVADGFHSLSDLLSDLVVWFGIHLGRAEPDRNHPFGHGRIETLASLGIGLLLLLTGLGLGYEAILSLINREYGVPGWGAALVALASLGAKEWAYRFTLAAGQKLNSSSLMANAWHHRSDALSSLAVLVGIGAGLINPAWAFMDQVAALVVAGMIIKVAWEIGQGALLEVVDTAPPSKVVEALIAKIETVEGVTEAKDCRVRRSGPNLLIECTVLVEGSMTVFEAHRVADQVEASVRKCEHPVLSATVHIEPDIQ